MIRKVKNIIFQFILNLSVVKWLYYYKWYYKTLPQRKLFVASNIKIQSINTTINDIVLNKKSISRFGDGELRYLLPNEHLVFQPNNVKLQNKLIEVLQSNLQNHIVAMPQPITSVKYFTLSNRYWWINFLNNFGNKLHPIIDFNKVYGNSFMTRFYLDFDNRKHVNKTVNNLKKIWADKDVLIIEGEFSRLGVGNDLFAKASSLHRILCPSKNAFENYDLIYENAQNFGKNKLILIALGPTATVLAYDLAKIGYWAIDIGHIDIEYMWMLKKATLKMPIKGRYVAEAKINQDFELETKDFLKYQESIIQNLSDI